MKTQVLIMHGGHATDINEDFLQHLRDRAFSINNLQLKQKWTDHLQKDLGNDFEVFAPKMPNKENAKYEEWKIWFEKCIPFLSDNVILIGHSLGGLFFVKYFSENIFPKKVKALIMVAAPYLGKNGKHGRNRNFTLTDNLESIYEKVEKILFFHSPDDPIVPVSDFEEFKKKLPKAEFKLLEGQAHFNEVSFPELVSDIKNLVK